VGVHGGGEVLGGQGPTSAPWAVSPPSCPPRGRPAPRCQARKTHPQTAPGGRAVLGAEEAGGCVGERACKRWHPPARLGLGRQAAWGRARWSARTCSGGGRRSSAPPGGGGAAVQENAEWSYWRAYLRGSWERLGGLVRALAARCTATATLAATAPSPPHLSCWDGWGGWGGWERLTHRPCLGWPPTAAARAKSGA
jgi:hypothetical protein